MWPRSKTSRAQGLGKSTRLRIASCPQGAFLPCSILYYHCHSALSFFSKAKHTKHRLNDNTCHPKLTFSHPNKGNNKLESEEGGSLSPHPASDPAWEPSLVLTAASPVTWGEGGEGCLNITMTTETFRYWSNRPAREALFPRVAALFQAVVWEGQECQGNSIHKHKTTGPCWESCILINGSSS